MTSDSEVWVLDSLGGRSFICSTHSTREPGGTHPPYLKKAITAPLRQGSQPKSCLTSVFLRHLRRDISDTPALSRGQMAQGFVLHLDSPRTFTRFKNQFRRRRVAGSRLLRLASGISSAKQAKLSGRRRRNRGPLMILTCNHESGPVHEESLLAARTAE